MSKAIYVCVPRMEGKRTSQRLDDSWLLTAGVEVVGPEVHPVARQLL